MSNPTPKTCRTCAHRSGFSMDLGRCMLSGYYLETERKFHTVCDADFSGWVQREPLSVRIKRVFYAVSERTS